jgi:hypothetical protein
MMNLTPKQALAHYNSAYNNTAYGSACDEFIWILGAGSDLSEDAIQNTSDYIALSNMLTNVALEICGHPAYHGEGWKLATSLNAVTRPRHQDGHIDHEAIQKLWHIIDGYLGIYRRHMTEFYDKLEADVHAKATLHIETVWTLTEDAVRVASDVPDWNGRSTYHLAGAAEGILRTATLMLAQKSDEISPSRFGYAAEKLGRAIRDLTYALTEIQPHFKGKSYFATLRETLSKLLEEA